jgi:hypothetical protein
VLRMSFCNFEFVNIDLKCLKFGQFSLELNIHGRMPGFGSLDLITLH